MAQVDAEAESEIVCAGACISTIVAVVGTVAISGTAGVISGASECFAYGSIVLRKGDNGQTEAVPMETVKEGDQVLVKGASGLHFSPAVAVDLHPETD